jgi:hypothetical protein
MFVWRELHDGMCRPTFCKMLGDISEKRAASILRVEEQSVLAIGKQRFSLLLGSELDYLGLE